MIYVLGRLILVSGISGTNAKLWEILQFIVTILNILAEFISMPFRKHWLWVLTVACLTFIQTDNAGYTMPWYVPGNEKGNLA